MHGPTRTPHDLERSLADERHFQRIRDADMRWQTALAEAEREYSAGKLPKNFAAYNAAVQSADRANHDAIAASEAQRQHDFAEIDVEDDSDEITEVPPVELAST